MKRLLFILFICCCYNAGAETYYFSDLSGDDSRTSLEAQSALTPWKTLDKLNSIFNSLNAGDSILFERGNTFYGSITVTQSGSISAPIVLSSYGTGNKPVIEGFVSLGGWVSSGNGIYESYEPALGASVNMVVLDGIDQQMGRYPNKDASNRGYLTFESHSTNVSITDNELPSAPNWQNAELVIRSQRWAIERRLITSHTGGTLRYAALQYTPVDKSGYFIQNDIRTLDQFGEWYYDPSAKKMYMYFGSNSPNAHTVKVSSIDTLFNMYNLDNVVVDGLVFEGSNVKAMNFYSVDLGETKVTNCDIKFAGINGLVTGSCKNMDIEGNTVSDAHNFGILLSATGWYKLVNNVIRRVALIPGMGTTGSNNSVGVAVLSGQNNLISGNIIDSTGYTALRFSGDSVEIRNNFIQHYCLNVDDGGGIMTGSNFIAPPNYGRKIINNIVLNGSGALEGTGSTVGATNGIYLDDDASGIIVEGNTVANNNKDGIYLHNNHDCFIINNTVYNSTISQLRLTHNSGHNAFRNIITNNNLLVAKTPVESTLFSQTDATDLNFNFWGNIDSNWHARPLLQTTIIKAVKPSYNQNLTIGDWNALSTFDQHSLISPKTFVSTINPDDSIRFEYNATNAVRTVTLDKIYIDLKKNQYSGTVDLQPFSSLILLPVPIAPSVSITNPSDSTNFLPSSDITITATAADADGTVSKVEFYNGNTLLATSVASPYTFTWPNVVSGNYSITAKATDNDSVTTTSQAVIILVNQPPTISITNPANNAAYAAPASISITATAADVDGTISKVEFYNGSTLIGSANTSPYTFTWANVPFGSYSITAKATDNGFLTSTSSSINVLVNQPPTINISSPANNATFADPATITINATATDADGTVSKVEFYNGTSLLGTDYTSPYAYAWTNVSSGNYSITAVATDNGSLATTSSIVNILVNAPPSVSITSPLFNATFSAPASIIIDAVAADADGSVSKVEFYNGSALIGTVNNSPYRFTWSNVSSGNYVVTAKATDNGGLVTTSGAINISVNEPPSVSISNPVNNAMYASPAIITLNANATDADGTITKVEYYNGNTLIGAVTTSPYTFIWTNVPPGNYSIKAVATDNRSLTTTSSPVNILVNQPPAISITSPTNNVSFGSPANISISANAVDVDGTVSKVEFYNGGSLLATVSSSPYNFIWSNVPPGNYFLTAKATDNGSLTTTSSVVNVSVNTPPTVSITNPVSNATFASPASITINANAFDVDGTISKVDFYSGGIFLGSDNTNPYSITWANVSSGTYSLTAVAVDNGGQATTSVPVVVSVYTPNIPPTVSISSPSKNATFPAPASITITATAADADGTITKVDFYNGTTFLGTDNTSPYSFVWANVLSGNYSITAKATDNGSLVTTSAAINISVNQAPSVNITSPVNNAIFNAPASVTINATATDADGTISKVDFYNGATLIGTDNTTPFSFTWTNVVAGSYSITAKATDNGSLITTSSIVTISVSAANIPPTVSITSPANNAIFAAPASVTINANAADADGTISKVDFYNGTTLIGTDNTSPYSFTWASVAAGSYSITVKATDNKSAVTTSSPIAVSVNSAPTVSITSPANNAKYNTPASITISATASDPGGSISKVDFYNGTTLLGTDNTSPYSYAWTNVAAGNYSITAKATDNSSLATTSTAIAVSVNAAPTVSITSPVNNTVYSSPATVTINASAADADGTISKVDFYKGTTLLGTDNAAPYSYTWSGVAAGSYSITAKATDNASAVTTSSAVTVSVNAAPTVSVTSPVKNTVFTAPASITIKATAADPGGAVSKVDFYNGATLIGTDNTSPYSITWTNVQSGNYSLTAKATDNTSLTTTSTSVAIAVNGAPTVTLTSPSNNASFIPPATIVINATAADPGGSVSKVEFYNGTTKINTDLTSPYSYSWPNVASGTYTITAKATDNSSKVTTSGAVTISVNTPPTVSITNPPNNANYAAPGNMVLIANAADPGGSISKVDFYNGATLLGTDNTSPYSINWNNVPIGTYTITAKATDNLGASTVSAPVSVIITQSITYLLPGDNLSSMFADDNLFEVR
ncbi:MAG: Ig-like domain-containing protein [Ginsengibacter sp.]